MQRYTSHYKRTKRTAFNFATTALTLRPAKKREKAKSPSYLPKFTKQDNVYKDPSWLRSHPMNLVLLLRSKAAESKSQTTSVFPFHALQLIWHTHQDVKCIRILLTDLS